MIRLGLLGKDSLIKIKAESEETYKSVGSKNSLTVWALPNLGITNLRRKSRAYILERKDTVIQFEHYFIVR